MRRMMNSEIRKRDGLREEGELGELVKRLTNDPLNTLDLEALPSAEHGKLTDPEGIQAEVNDYFHQWCAIPDDLESAARQLTSYEDFWRTLSNPPEDNFDILLHKDSSIAQHFHKGQRKMCALKATSVVRTQLQDTHNPDVTSADFTA
jgi:hypothetical protein